MANIQEGKTIVPGTAVVNLPISLGLSQPRTLTSEKKLMRPPFKD